MVKVKEKWVRVYTSRIMHFNATTTQCIEGTHLAIKLALESSESLTRSFSSLDRWLRLHHEENSLQNESESIGIDPLLVNTCKDRLAPLLGKVTQFALDKVKNKLLKATIYEACLYELHVNYNIPCRHMLPKEGTVMLSIISTRWLLFHNRDWPDSNSQELDLANLKSSDTFFHSKKLDKILAVPAIDLSEVKMPEKIVEKGLPSGTK
ncbi:hypothetical protein C2G38_2176751 [Gigaspora rosea]|uniref:Uncharacterized protein n=1 Tax=Gigaspora rosea TaxID=44941 RepID=A0A397VJ70_9GLOM|nr:hypothetical protein C2G38_2176751 [Gigaspora rosea]